MEREPVTASRRDGRIANRISYELRGINRVTCDKFLGYCL